MDADVSPRRGTVTRKSDLRLTLIRNPAIRIAHPDQRGRGVCHHTEALFAFTKDSFDFAPSCALRQQATDHDRLEGDEKHTDQDKLPVKFPNCWLSIKDSRTRW